MNIDYDSKIQGNSIKTYLIKVNHILFHGLYKKWIITELNKFQNDIVI